VLFWDPFCGSGTIAVEAAMLMTNRAPGMNRYFDAERFPAFGKDIFHEARTEAKDLVIRDSKFEVYASDIDPECVHIAIESAKHAGVYEQMKIFRADALTIKTGGRRGTVVCNPPYGERMMTLKEAETLYRKMGEHFKSLDRWQIYVLTSHDRFGNVYGRRPDKVRKLYNGMIPCYFYQFFKNDKV
jgi:putative N6-adenine-specific DNA methylase